MSEEYIENIGSAATDTPVSGGIGSAAVDEGTALVSAEPDNPAEGAIGSAAADSPVSGDLGSAAVDEAVEGSMSSADDSQGVSDIATGQEDPEEREIPVAEEEGTESEVVNTTSLDGDVMIGRNVAMGGRAEIQGSVYIGHNLVVKGWLDAENIKGVNKGIFMTLEELEAAYPHPQDGWLAGVGTSTPFDAYVGKDGAWENTGGTIELNVDMDEIREEMEEMQGQIDDLTIDSGAFYNVDANHPIVGTHYTLSTAVAAVAADTSIADERKGGMVIQFWDGNEWEMYKYKLVYDPENPEEFADVDNWEMFDSSGGTVTTTDQIYDRHLDKTQDVINAELSERTFRKFPTRADFPLIGKNNTLYMDRETGFLYTWETNHYEMAGDTWRNIKMIIGNTDVVLE